MALEPALEDFFFPRRVGMKVSQGNSIREILGVDGLILVRYFGSSLIYAKKGSVKDSRLAMKVKY